ncbi:division/cell wall cluster transcriptional repressor MraZ [Bifidobacterium aquikefiri]|uniref:Transcriptional regulator MraZ n=2 Tax=Bifidobacterium aquikefiri TaxID=1653207 RepID=A0A261G6N0_9BIFI|nr:division/cell wall cluster transcriptional repressor MraZ [Bifidobacterium aquikefiri]
MTNDFVRNEQPDSNQEKGTLQPEQSQNVHRAQPSSPSPMSADHDNGFEMPALLLGTYTPKIDDKGRMALPAKLRSQFGDGLVMARGQERCVYLLPQSEFRRVAIQIQRTSMGNKAARDYLRVFLSGAVDEVPDRQGRVLVPQMLRSYAHLNTEVVVIGVGTRAELWDSASWQSYLESKEQGYSDIADDVLPEVDF